MKRLLEKSTALVLIAVVFSLIASLAALAWGAVETVRIVIHLASNLGRDIKPSVEFIGLIDVFLIATALLFFAVSLYELFIGELKLPEWLCVRDLQDLKVKLSSVIILVMAVTFVEHLVQWEDALNTLYFGLAISAVSLTLIFIGRYDQDRGKP